MLGVVIFVRGPDEFHSKARVQWKDNALAQIAKQTSDPAAILKEIEAMKLTPPDSEWWETWYSQDLIVMTNGQWMAYRSICQKEDDRIKDIFLGHGSDGRWYYSTYHFCVNMQNLSVNTTFGGPPRSLMDFSNYYHLKEFDGHSDECLKDSRGPTTSRMRYRL